MATLGKIRNRAGLLVGVVGAALFAFIIGDFLKSGSTFFHQSKEKIAIVDGQSINIQDYQAKMEEMTEMYKKRTGNSSLSEENQYQIRQSVFDNMVNTIILEKETEKLGMSVSKEELSDMILGDNISPIILQMPDFQNPQTRSFDKNRLIEFLQTVEAEDLSSYSEAERQQIEAARKYWLFWEQAIKHQKLEGKYTGLLTKAIVVNSLDAKAAHEDSKTSVDIDFVFKPYTAVADTLVTVSDSEVAKLYQERKNMFKQEEGRVIDMISVSIVPSQADFQEVEKIITKVKGDFVSNAEVVEIVNENSDVKFIDAYKSMSEIDPAIKGFVETAAINDVQGPFLNGNTYRMCKLIGKTSAPDSIKFNQLVLPEINDIAKLKEISDSLINVIKAGKSFTDLATEATQGRTNGDMGWITETNLVLAIDAKFKDELMNAPLNEVFVIKSSRGSHLVQLTQKTQPVTKYKLADIQMAVSPSSATYSDLYNKLSQYIAKNKSLETFKSAATESGYLCQPEVTLQKNQPNIGGIGNSRPAVRWAFDHSKGSVSEVFECDGHFVVLAVEGSLNKGIRSLETVAELLKRELLNNKKAEKIIADWRSKNFTTVDQYAANTGIPKQSVKFVSFATRNINGIGVEPMINARAPFITTGKISEPLKGNAGVYIVGVVDKHVAEGPFDPNIQKQSMTTANAYKYMSRIVPTLRDKIKIEDNRIRFF